MAINKIFKDLDVNKLSRRKDPDFSAFLDESICEYVFSVTWTNNTGCNLNFLSGNRPPSTIWHPIIRTPISDDDGEISVRLGRFPKGTEINLAWGIQAVDAIPKMALLIVNVTEKKIFKIPEGNQFKKLDRGEFWQSSQKVSLP